MIARNFNILLPQKIDQCLTSHFSQISCDDPVVIFRFPFKILQMLPDQIRCRRCGGKKFRLEKRYEQEEHEQ